MSHPDAENGRTEAHCKRTGNDLEERLSPEHPLGRDDADAAAAAAAAAWVEFHGPGPKARQRPGGKATEHPELGRQARLFEYAATAVGSCLRPEQRRAEVPDGR